MITIINRGGTIWIVLAPYLILIKIPFCENVRKWNDLKNIYLNELQGCGNEVCAVLKQTAPATSLLSYEVRCENDTFCLPDLLMKSTVQPDNVEGGIVYGLTKGIDIAIEVRILLRVIRA